MHSIYDFFNQLGKKLGLISSYDWRYIYQDRSYRLDMHAPTPTQETEIKKLCATGVLEPIEGATFISSLYNQNLISFASYRKYNEYFRLSDFQVHAALFGTLVQAGRNISQNASVTGATVLFGIAPLVGVMIGANIAYYQSKTNKYKNIKDVNFNVFPKDKNDDSLFVISKQKNRTLLFDQCNERLISKIENRDLEQKDTIKFIPLSKARFGMQAGTLPWFFDRYFENFPEQERRYYFISAFFCERFYFANILPVTSRNFYESLMETLSAHLQADLRSEKLSSIELAVKVAGAVNINTKNSNYSLNDVERQIGGVKTIFMPLDYYLYKDSGVCFEKSHIFAYILRELRTSNIFIGDIVLCSIESESTVRYISKTYERKYSENLAGLGHTYCMIFPCNELPIIIDCANRFVFQFKNYESFKEYLEYVHKDSRIKSGTYITIVTDDNLKSANYFGEGVVSCLLAIYEKNQANKSQSKLRMSPL